MHKGERREEMGEQWQRERERENKHEGNIINGEREWVTVEKSFLDLLLRHTPSK